MTLTSADLRLVRVGYDHPDATALAERAQAFYVQLYGGPDSTELTVADFAPPFGGFWVGYLGSAPVATGGWRFTAAGPVGERPAEIKRMYVDDGYRRAGLARRMLDTLESDAYAGGADWLILETGRPQVAAVALYRACGYVEIPNYGHYATEPSVLSLGKRLG